MTDTIAFIGGGNMASAILGGLVAAGHSRSGLLVVEPMPAQRALLEERFGIHASAEADAALADARLVVWAVKPQLFAAAAAPCRPHVGHALQVSVMAGIRSDALVAATGSERVVRTMPNTPALVGAGIAALFARDAVSATERAEVESLLAPTGQTVWVGEEEQLDAVTAISGSGPAYVFHLIEAMLAAAREAGLPEATARRLAVQTVAGSAALAAASTESPETLRKSVTSPGGTTFAAMTVLEARGVKEALVAAMRAARARAHELGDAFGTPSA